MDGYNNYGSMQWNLFTTSELAGQLTSALVKEIFISFQGSQTRIFPFCNPCGGYQDLDKI